MAKTVLTTTDALRKVSWEETLFRDTLINSFFMKNLSGDAVDNLLKGMTEGKIESLPDNVLHIINDMGAKGKTKTQKGDKLTFGLIPRLDPKTDQGVTSGQTLKGKEVAITSYSYDIELERYRQAVSQGGPMDWARAAFNMPKEAESALKTWGRDKLELLCCQALEASPTNIFFTTGATGAIGRTATLATAKTALTLAGSKLTPLFLSQIKSWAKVGGGRASGQIPLRPVIVDGQPYYVYVTYEDSLLDWKTDSTVQQAAREAEARGKDNPIFTGASYIHDHVVIHTHEYVTTGTDGGGASVPWNYGYLLGAQALVVGFGERPSLVEETDDYEEDHYVAWRMTAKIEKPQFNSKDYGSIITVTARTNNSGVVAT